VAGSQLCCLAPPPEIPGVTVLRTRGWEVLPAGVEARHTARRGGGGRGGGGGGCRVLLRLQQELVDVRLVVPVPWGEEGRDGRGKGRRRGDDRLGGVDEGGVIVVVEEAGKECG